MADPATLQAQLETLRALRAQGVRRVRFGDDEVEYRTDAEMAAAIGAIEQQIAAAEARPAIGVFYPRTISRW